MIRTLISVDNSLYLHWQTQLLAATFHQVQQPGVLTRLVSTAPSETVRPIEGIETVITRAYSPDPRSGDNYPPYNKPGSIAEWLSANPGSDDETILLIDADFVFFDQVLVEAAAGRPLGHPIGYMKPDWPGADIVLKRHCRVSFDKLPSVGVPNVLRRSDLRLIADRWYELTRQLRDDTVTREAADWICEMWAYSIACAEVGLEHIEQCLAHFQGDIRVELPLLHYCYHSESADGKWSWSKRSYSAWTKLEPCPLNTTMATQRLHALVAAQAEKHEFQDLANSAM